MFTQKCFILKNSPELRNKLYRLGNRNGTWLNDAGDMLSANQTLFKCWDSDLGSDSMLTNNGYINCGTNEELFLAIAALRDDSDIDNNQVFIHQDGNFYKCECDSKIDMWGDFEEPELYPRKATVSELIELYKK